jgi:hypothetical protein
VKEQKMKTTLLFGIAILCASATAFGADGLGKGIKPYLAVGLDFAQGHSRDLTQATFGGIGSFSGEFGFQFLHGNSGVSIRPNIGIAKMLSGDPPLLESGEPKHPVYDLMGIYGGADIVYAPWNKWPIILSTGPSFHVWNVDEVNVPFGKPSQGAKGLKFGWRIGTGYEINSQFRVELTYALTEWRSTASLPFRQGWNPSSPSYFCLKASYNF